MIVCVCHNISENEIQSAIEKGLDDMDSLRENLGIGTSCGKCKSCTKKILRDYVSENKKRRTENSSPFFISLTPVI